MAANSIDFICWWCECSPNALRSLASSRKVGLGWAVFGGKPYGLCDYPLPSLSMMGILPDVVREWPKLKSKTMRCFAISLMPCGHKHPLICRWGCGYFERLHHYDVAQIPLRIADWRHPQVISATKVHKNNEIYKTKWKKNGATHPGRQPIV